MHEAVGRMGENVIIKKNYFHNDVILTTKKIGLSTNNLERVCFILFVLCESMVIA